MKKGWVPKPILEELNKLILIQLSKNFKLEHFDNDLMNKMRTITELNLEILQLKIDNLEEGSD